MLTPKEKDFIRYWETNRLRRKKVVRQFLIGIPIGLLFVIPIAINFSSGWYRRADMEAKSQDFNPLVLLVALLLIVGFTAIFYQRHLWDQYEQRYQELRARLQKDDTAAASLTPAATTPTGDPAPTPPAITPTGDPAPTPPAGAPNTPKSG